MTAEHLLDCLRVQALQDVTNRRVRRRTLPAQAECGVQLATMHFDEGLDGAERIAAGDHGEDREQQDVG